MPATGALPPSAELAALLARWGPGEISAEQLADMQCQLSRQAPPAGRAQPSPTGSESGSRQAPSERVVVFRPRSVLVVLGVLAAVAAALEFVLVARSGLVLIAVAGFLALALNPVVELFQRRGLKRHWAVAAVCLLALALLALLMLILIPPLVRQVSDLVQAAPDFVSKLNAGRGPAGFLERRYFVVERVRSATNGQGFATLGGAALSGLGVLKGVAASVVGVIIVAFLTLFMLLEGPAWRSRLIELVPEQSRPAAERIGSGIYKVVGGFVTGNLLASLLAGVVATTLLLAARVPYALPLGLFVVLIELVPYIGPVVVTGLLSTVALSQGLAPGLVVFGVLLAYHLVEGHTLRPMIYGRALKLSALAVLVAIVLGTEVAGILGALAAIPVAGAVQVILSEVLRQRGERSAAATGA